MKFVEPFFRSLLVAFCGLWLLYKPLAGPLLICLLLLSLVGWFKKENERIFYGEQPIEVATTIIALDLFYEITQNKKYKDQLQLAFVWFLGNNHLKQIMYNPENGASYDGLEDTHVNINQGAESTLCFFKARLIMEKYSEYNLMNSYPILKEELSRF